MTPAKPHRIEITLSDDKLASLDAARQHEPRASFIKRAIDAQVRAALSSSETPERTYEQVQRERDAVRKRPLTPEQDAFIAKTVAERKPLPRGSASPSLERFSKAQRKGGEG